MTRQHRQGLDEIRALAHELDGDVQELVERVREAQDALGAVDPRRSADGQHDPGPPIAFVHIPKTAGGTVTSMFAGAYTRACIHKAGNYLNAGEKALRNIKMGPRGWELWRARGGRLSVGHLPFGLFREHLPEDTRYITFLREPVDRVLSHYYRHVHRPGQLAEQRGGKPTAASIEEALEGPPPQLNDLATRLLCGDPAPLGKLPADALEKAKANLREFAFVGIHERFWESVVLLQRTLDLDLVPAVHRHVSIERPTVEEIRDEERDLIVEFNRLDVELYTFAQGLFEETLAAASDDRLSADVETLRSSSAALNESALRDARSLLERELPAGTSKPQEALRAAAAADGISPAALKRASTSLVVREKNDDGVRVWTRPEDGQVTVARTRPE